MEGYELAVGKEYAIQLILKLFIEDEENSEKDKEKALRLFKWLGQLEPYEPEIDILFDYNDEYFNYEKDGDFIINVMKKYGGMLPCDSNLAMNYGDALESLEYQKKWK
jgi:hypothetical protein